MENKSQVNGSSSSSSSLHHLFSPKDSPSLSSTSEILGSIFPPPPPVQGKDSIHSDHTTDGKGQSNGTTNNDKSSSIYHTETMEPCYLSSSIYYGGQEYYSPKQQTTDAPLYFRKEGEEDDPIGINSNGASRGNWWQGMKL
ncbi:hypothetical protein ERO13_D10G238356v2 [Gossypium hirsutum]|uniref:Uncharacterized protein n=2 Tax=Gossypium TaxID=3633 RepID=A0A5J5PWT4_GOSBA|nr:hypothetical protein ES319_D10G276200v1 [Gossypium barbadense]KAG4127842.1 hypothetical protein ERO13_D10G238356v2 [Gossypium hirsutum]TYH51829.1 hypothetical protein ES332_D10G306600v1 [Gossypium tomentosum]